MRFRCTSILALAVFSLSACYNTYQIPKDDFVKLQRVEEGDGVLVKAQDGAQLEVTRQSSLFVKSETGRRYPITPFNFKVTSSQLVAPDRDYILMLDQLKAYEVDVPSAGKTAALIGAGAAVAAGLIVILVLTSGEKSFAE